MNTISVLLVDDNLTFLRIATRFLQKHNDIVIAGAFNGGKEAMEQAHTLQPDIVLIDLAMSDLPGLEAIPRLRVMLPGAGIIALTLLDANSYRPAALAAGADDFVSKATMSTDLLPAVWRTAQAKRLAQQKLVSVTACRVRGERDDKR
ncbi:MAG: response regulator transcription factor [Anaerolineae bacterium]